MAHLSRDDLRKLQNDAESAKVTIICGGEKWSVHRALVLLHSSKLGRTHPDETAKDMATEIDLSDEDPDVVRGVIDFITTNDCEVVGHKACYFLDMCKFANKYDMPVLARKANEQARSAWTLRRVTGELYLDFAEQVYKSLPVSKELFKVVIADLAQTWKNQNDTDAYHQLLISNPGLAIHLIRKLCSELKPKKS